MAESAPHHRESHPGMDAALIAFDAGMLHRVVAEGGRRDEFTARQGETLRGRYRIAEGLVDELQEAAAKLVNFRKGVGLTPMVDRPQDRPHRDRDRPTGRK